ncbi:DNA/RNA nuclease SfsA [Prochlorococcus sp. MIT 1341]|uniref:DNA/RNA nuclease SfsA n=1 Tax=Prochlorococcus sp. MIT 1341 TaxID=3096221 RepID=UPI002A75E224|nr:DNA/RNA nuclease SfsA [Prochlorococcus sp. MIT 1341]
MIGKTLITFPPLEEGILLRRYKRFLADVELTNGDVVTAHCPNTGPMKGILCNGGRVRLRHVPSPTRKLAWTWEQAEVSSSNGSKCWVGVNTHLSNSLVRFAIEAGLLEQELGPISQIQKEVPYGKEKRSRIDLLLKPFESAKDIRQIYVEVKNTTWTESLVALFPDTVTERGQKHLRELVDVLPDSRAVLLPCLSRMDVESFAPGDLADPEYGKLFRIALAAGVEVIPCCFGFSRDQITWEGKRPYLKKQTA